MNLRRNFLLGASSIVIAGFATPSFSSDLPMPSMAEPITYVSTCDAFGAGYFQIPGKDTCLKIGGRIRSQIVSGNFMKNKDLTDYDGDKPEEYGLYTRGYLYLDSMTALDIGTITTKAIMLYEWGEDSETTPKFEDAYLQFSTGDNAFLVGNTISLFDGFIGYSAMGLTRRNFSEYYPVQANAVAHLGGGISVGFSVEDSAVRGGPTDMADFAAMAELKQSWGSFRISGGVHRQFENAEEIGNRDFQRYLAETMPDSYFNNLDPEDSNYDMDLIEPKNSYGYGVNATAKFNVPAGVNPTELTFQATYMDSAISYLGGAGAFYGGWDSDQIRAGLSNAVADMAGYSGYAITGGVKQPLTDTITLAFDASYAAISADFEFENGSPAPHTRLTNVDSNIDRYAIDGSVIWSPYAGLAFSVSAGYASTNVEQSGSITKISDGSEAFPNSFKESFDEAYVGTRLQYTF